MFGDKVPDIEHFVPELLMLVPNAKFIHVVRDGRATAASKHQRAHKNLKLAGQEWVESITMGLNNVAMLGEDQYKMVRYEDLLTQPEAVLKELCHFLELPFESSMLEAATSGNEDDQYVKSALDPSKADAFKKQLSSSQLQQLERIQAPFLKRFGYELTHSKALQQHRPMTVGKRLRLSQANNLRQLFIGKRMGMIDRKNVELRISWSSRIKTFVYMLAYDLMPKRTLRRVFRKRFVKQLHLPADRHG